MGKKHLNIVILLYLLFTLGVLSGCVNDKNVNDPREKEIVQLVVNEKYDEASLKADELYKGEADKLAETLEWINKYKNIDQNRQKQLQELYLSNKLEIQSGYTYEVRRDYIYINGRVKNISNENISYFEVLVDFMDNEGNILNSDYTNDGLLLKPGAMREFEIMHKYNSEYKKYRLSIGKVK